MRFLKAPFFREFTLPRFFTVLTASGVLAFGLYNIHAVAKITEGGVLGMILLLEHWLHISPSITSFFLDGACYLTGWLVIGGGFALYSVIATTGFSVFYAIFERFDPVWPQLAHMPLAACLLGALFVGIGAGVCVRIGGAAGGDDALAMIISKATGLEIQWAYLATDLTVLLLSATYIPFGRVCWSILSAFLSGQIIGWIQKLKLQKRPLT